MAATQRASDAVEFHQANADAVRAAKEAARSVDARYRFQQAHDAHMTSVRMLARRPRLLDRANMLRLAAQQQRALPRSRQTIGLADRYDQMAADTETAAALSLDRADHWHTVAAAHAAAAREHENNYPSDAELVAHAARTVAAVASGTVEAAPDTTADSAETKSEDESRETRRRLR